MGYACPVCGDPQADAGHLANHLAFTAMLRGGDHEDWLDEHVPDWEASDEATLGERVAALADEEEYPQVFEDTTGGSQGHSHQSHSHQGHDRGHAHGQETAHDRESGYADAGDLPPGADALADDGAEDLDADVDEIVAEAREMTRKRRESGTGDSETADEEEANDASDDGESEAE